MHTTQYTQLYLHYNSNHVHMYNSATTNILLTRRTWLRLSFAILNQEQGNTPLYILFIYFAILNQEEGIHLYTFYLYIRSIQFHTLFSAAHTKPRV